MIDNDEDVRFGVWRLVFDGLCLMERAASRSRWGTVFMNNR